MSTRARRWRRLGWILALVALAGLVALAVQVRRPATAVATVVEPIDRGAFVREVTGTGVVEAVQQRTVGFASGGTVDAVAVAEGDEVRAGSLLARLDTASLERERSSTSASLASALAERASVLAQQASDRFEAANAVTAATEQRNRATRSLADTERDVATSRDLFDLGAIARSELRASEDALERARNALQEAERALATARSREANLATVAAAQRASVDARVTQLETQLANLEARLEDAELRSPIDGVVTQVLAETGDLVGTHGVITVADIGRLRVQARFDESRALELAVGQPATVVPDADARQRIAARVLRISPVAARDAGVAQVSAELAFDGDRTLDLSLVRPGYTVTVRVRVRELEDALLVPLEAISEGPDGNYVTLVDPSGRERGQAAHVPVRVIERNPTVAAVEGPLQAGDLIAVVGLDAIPDGATVSFPNTFPRRDGGP